MPSALPPIVLIPGMQCDERMFEALIARLRSEIPELRIRTHVIRQSGQNAAVSALLSRLDEPTVLVGHSLGATVAMAAAREIPERVAGLALVCASPRPPRPAQISYWTGLMRRLQHGQLNQIVDEIVPALVGSSMPAATQPAGTVSACRRMALATGAEGLAAQLKIQLDRIDERPGLRGFHGPVLAMAADDDCLVPTEATREISASALRGDFALFTGATHMAPLTEPGMVSRTLVAWLKHQFAHQTPQRTNPETEKVSS